MEPKNGMVYEYAWIAIIIAMLTGFAASLAYYSFVLDVNPACKAYRATEDLLSEIRAKAEQGGVYEVAPGVYEVYIIGRQFVWIPSEIVLRDPKQVTFYVVAEDVIHGFEVAGTNVNFMIFPGYVAEFTWYPPSDLEGELIMVCNEYCGVGHQFMKGKLIIERTEALSGDDGLSLGEIIHLLTLYVAPSLAGMG
jgi:cytochrome c oxidase subunit 2